MRKLTAWMLVAGLALAGAACSDDDGDDGADGGNGGDTAGEDGGTELPGGTVAPEHVAFCDGYQDAVDEMRAAADEGDDLTATREAFAAVAEDAPEEIADDMAAVLEVMAGVDTPAELLLAASDPETAEPSQTVNTWVSDNCGYDPTAS